MWDFWSLSPESLHQVTILFSDRGLPKSLRHINGYGSHTYSFINAAGERFWVKFHFKTQQGIATLTNREAEAIVATDRESSQRDLFTAIERGEFPRWKFQVQIMPEQEAENYHLNPFDLTKVWPHKDYPLIDVGMMELNRNPENYFAEVEQSAFSPSNIVPGISWSPDKMLQARVFSYHDTHLHRLGPNYHLIPANAPKNAHENSYQRDGFMRVDANGGSGSNYWPNSFGGPSPDPTAGEPPFELSGQAGRYPFVHPNDDFVQSGSLYRKVMSDEDREHLIDNIVNHLGKAQKRIQLRQTALFYKSYQEYGRRVAEGIGLDVIEVKRLADMSHEERAKATEEKV